MNANSRRLKQMAYNKKRKQHKADQCNPIEHLRKMPAIMKCKTDSRTFWENICLSWGPDWFRWLKPRKPEVEVQHI